MNEGLIPLRYAKALYKVAAEKNETQLMYKLMCSLADNFEKAPALAQTLANPFVSADDKATLMNTAAGVENPVPLFDDFLKLLEQNSRIMFMREIALSYIDIFRRANNIYQVKVQSAAPMSQQESDRLRALVEKHLNGAELEYNTSVNPSLIGGFTVTVGNERIDASISNELKQLRLNLIRK